MKALLQRVKNASVEVEGERVGEIGSGLLIFLGVEKNDDETKVLKLLEKVLGYRVFPDAGGKMNLSLIDVKGGLLVVSQFTLVADTRKGMRPSFSTAGAPSESKLLYESFIARAKNKGVFVQQGVFGADMQVSLINDGPVTFLLEN